MSVCPVSVYNICRNYIWPGEGWSGPRNQPQRYNAATSADHRRLLLAQINKRLSLADPKKTDKHTFQHKPPYRACTLNFPVCNHVWKLITSHSPCKPSAGLIMQGTRHLGGRHRRPSLDRRRRLRQAGLHQPLRPAATRTAPPGWRRMLAAHQDWTPCKTLPAPAFHALQAPRVWFHLFRQTALPHKKSTHSSKEEAFPAHASSTYGIFTCIWAMHRHSSPSINVAEGLSTWAGEQQL